MLGHERHISHEDLLLFRSTDALVQQLHASFQITFVCKFVQLRILFVELRLAERERCERHLKFLFRVIVDGREFFEYLSKTFLYKPVEGHELVLDKVWELDQGLLITRKILLLYSR